MTRLSYQGLGGLDMRVYRISHLGGATAMKDVNYRPSRTASSSSKFPLIAAEQISFRCAAISSLETDSLYTVE